MNVNPDLFRSTHTAFAARSPLARFATLLVALILFLVVLVIAVPLLLLLAIILMLRALVLGVRNAIFAGPRPPRAPLDEPARPAPHAPIPARDDEGRQNVRVRQG